MELSREPQPTGRCCGCMGALPPRPSPHSSQAGGRSDGCASPVCPGLPRCDKHGEAFLSSLAVQGLLAANVNFSLCSFFNCLNPCVLQKRRPGLPEGQGVPRITAIECRAAAEPCHQDD